MTAVEQSTLGDVIADNGRRKRCAPGQMLFGEGDSSHSVYYCVVGRIRIFVTLPSGKELLLGIKRSGDEFGELSALDGRPRSASAVAIEQSEVAILPARRFHELLAESPQLGVAVCQSLSAQLRLANDRLITRNSNDVAVRTGRMLVELSSLMMRHNEPSDEYEIIVTQTELANWIGATREATARALSGFRRAGLVRTGRGRIAVIDVLGLDDAVGAGRTSTGPTTHQV